MSNKNSIINSKENQIKKWFKDWKIQLSEHKYLIILAMIFVFIAELISYYASKYVDKSQTVAVPDLILDAIPTVRLDFLYAYGFMIVCSIILLYTLFFKVKEFHVIMLQFCLLVIIRSIFITLTHLGTPANASILVNAPEFFRAVNFQNDLFFSGHTAIPFMAFLIFRKEAIGKFFLLMTIILSSTVLLMHVHYSIDVFSAFFITYGVYSFGQWIITKEENHIQTKSTTK